MVPKKRSSALTKTVASVAAAFTLAAMTTGCSTLPVSSSIGSPLSGDDQQNSQFCLDFTQAQAKAAAVAVGTPKTEVYKEFGISGDDMMRKLSKEEVNRAIYGQPIINFNFEQREDVQKFANSLEGRAITCENVHSKRKFGLTHAQTQKDGYQYTMTFIFRNNALYDPINVSGTPVHTKTNRGYLSDFSPVDTAVRASRGGL